MAESIGLRAIIDLSNFNKGLSSYNKGIGSMNKNTAGFTSTATKQLGGLGSSLLKVGTIAGGAALAGVTALGAGLGAFAVSGIKQAKDLDQQMADIAAVMGKTKDEIGPLKDLILDLSINPNLKVSATEAATAIELLARNAVPMEDILGGMAEQTVALANATGADFGVAADLATDVMALFSSQGVSMAQAIDGITGVTTNSKFTVDDYADAMANMGGAASGLGLDFRQVNTLLAETAFTFKSGGEAGTALRNIFLRLSNPTGEMAAEMDKFGISLFDTEGNMRDMGAIATDLGNILQGEATITQTVGGVTSEMAKAAESAAKKLPALSNTIEEQSAQLAILQRELPAVTEMYGEGSPAVDKHRLKIQKLSNSLEENQAKQADMVSSIQAVQNAEEEVITTTKKLTDEERARLEGLLGGTRGVNALVAISKIQGEEFDDLTDKINAEGQAMKAAATRVDSLQGAMEIFKSIIQGVQIQVGDLFLPTLKDMLVAFADIASKQGPRVIAFFSTIADFLSKTVIPAVSNFIGKIKGLITTFQAGGLFGSRSGSFGSEGLLAALGIPPDAVAIIENIFNTVNEVIAGFQEGGIGGAFGALFSSESAGNALQGVIDFITQFLTDNWPIVQEQLTEWGNMFFGWVNETVVPAIPETLSAIIEGITTWATEQLPIIQEKTQEWATVFWDWVQTVVDNAGTSLAGIIASIGLWASSGETQGQLNELGVTLGDALVTGIQNMIDNQERMVEILTQVVTGLGIAALAITGLLIAVGAQIVAGIIEGIIENLTGGEIETAMITELPAILSAIGSDALTIAKVVGLDIILGIIGGLEDGIEQLTTTVEQIGTIILETIKDVLGISSPSTVFFQFGVDIIQGMIDGISSLLGGLAEIGSNILGSLFGGGEAETPEAAAPTMDFDPAEMLAGLESVNMATANFNLALSNITTLTLPLLSETFLLFATTTTEQLLLLLETGIMPIDLALIAITTVTLPALQAMVIAVSAAAISALSPVLAIILEMTSAMQALTVATTAWGNAALQAGTQAAEGFDKAADRLESKLIPAMEEARSVAESLADALERAASAAKDAGTSSANATGAGFKHGIGFQAGTPANTGGLLGLGFKIPTGFNNDSFPFFAQSGEEMLITPRGTSIEGLIFSRLASLLRGTAVQGGSVTNITNIHNYEMNIQTTSSARDNVRQFDVMRGMVGT